LSEYVSAINALMENVDSVWSDRIVCEELLSRIDSIYTYISTKEIASSQVVKGKERWLFYKSTSDGDSIGDYEGTNMFSTSILNTMLNQAIETQDDLESLGIKFAIIIAPNKENIYSEYMPDTYTHAETSRTDIMIDYLKENGVNIINPKQELLDNHNDYQLYYRYDTHWTQLGAYIGVKNVLDSWNIEVPSLSERSISSYNLSQNYHYCGEADLAKLVGIRNLFYNDEVEYEVNGTDIVDWEKFEDEHNNGKVSYFYNPQAKINATLLLVGDSFRTAMIPALREAFSDVYVVHRTIYTVDLLNEINPDYLLAEYVERYSMAIDGISFMVK
jgi:hypothetical protein